MSWWNERGLREKRSAEKECQIGNEADESWNEQAGFSSLSVPIWLHTRTHQHIYWCSTWVLMLSSSLSYQEPLKISNPQTLTIVPKPLLFVPPTEAYFSYVFNDLSELICQVDRK